MGKLFVALGGNNLVAEVAKQTLAFTGVDYKQPRKECGRHIYNPEDLGLKSIQQQTVEQVAHAIDGYDQALFFECRPGEQWPKTTPVTIVDHHEEHAGAPPTLLQLLAALELYGADRRAEAKQPEEKLAARTFSIALQSVRTALDRWIFLASLNDTGYIPALRIAGASKEEIDRVRAEDRRAFGVTPEHEAETERALREVKRDGPFTIVRVGHNKFSSVTDRLFGSYEQLAIITTDPEHPQVNFFGDGALCSLLFTHFGGRGGGAGYGQPGKEGYWEGNTPNHDGVLAVIREQLAAMRISSPTSS